ncbi:phage protein NinX family protein [Atlantibacter subterraneus]|uniref:phage protein NinX family protein n=1 Tax=Atlantibacter subterraneus TaxID=255519 RepID=UPI002FDCF54D
MTDYSKLSDFEINVAVFEALYNGSPDFKEGDNGAMTIISFEADVIGGEVIEIEAERGTFNPCNNPADAWPIIVSKKICIAFDVFAEPDDGGGWVASPAYYIEGERIRHDNPLRAAMIVFLMMQDSSHANS